MDGTNLTHITPNSAGDRTARLSLARLRQPWNAAELLSGTEQYIAALPDAERRASQDMMWSSICSEHDARHFYRQLLTAGPTLPWKMQDFLATWLADEVNHARGFKILYRALYDRSFEEIEQALQARAIDFSHMEELFDDLLSICLLFAYDELVTTRVYQANIPFYARFGSSALDEWIRRLVYDESQHYKAGMSIIVEYCREELPHSERILKKVIDIDLGQTDYRGTFVLDHVCPEFPFERAQLESLARRGILYRLRGR